jgi:hypothetical protein
VLPAFLSFHWRKCRPPEAFQEQADAPQRRICLGNAPASRGRIALSSQDPTSAKDEKIRK